MTTSNKLTTEVKSAKSKEVKSVDSKEVMPLGKINYILIAACVLLIMLGFYLMTGSANRQHVERGCVQFHSHRGGPDGGFGRLHTDDFCHHFQEKELQQPRRISIGNGLDTSIDFGAHSRPHRILAREQ